MISDYEHIRGLVEQVLFTAPGERVAQPDFGCDLGQLVFMPNTAAARGVVESRIRNALERWLAEVIVVQQVQVTPEAGMLRVTIRYQFCATGESRCDTFQRDLG